MEFIKTNNNLYSFERKIKVLNSVPLNVGNNNEVIFVKNDGFYKYDNSVWSKILNTNSSAITSPSRVVGEILCSTTQITSDEWLLCDGSSYDSSEYPELFTVTGSTTLPDFREALLVGVGENTTDTFVTHDIFTLFGTDREKTRLMQNHKHSISETPHCHPIAINTSSNHRHSCTSTPYMVYASGSHCICQCCCFWRKDSGTTNTSSANGNVCATNTTTAIESCYPIVDDVVYTDNAPMRTNSYGVLFYIRAK